VRDAELERTSEVHTGPHKPLSLLWGELLSCLELHARAES